MIADYEVTIRVRNNYFLTAMKNRGFYSMAALSDALGMSAQTLYDLVNLKVLPMGKNGDWRPSMKRLAKFLEVEPGSLIPPQHWDKVLIGNKVVREVNHDDLVNLEDWRPDPPMLPDAAIEQKELDQAINTALVSLLPREERVLRARFGIGIAEPQTLSELAHDMGIGQERVRQIESKAIRKLQHPSRSVALMALVENTLGGMWHPPGAARAASRPVFYEPEHARPAREAAEAEAEKLAEKAAEEKWLTTMKAATAIRHAKSQMAQALHLEDAKRWRKMALGSLVALRRDYPEHTEIFKVHYRKRGRRSSSVRAALKIVHQQQLEKAVKGIYQQENRITPTDPFTLQEVVKFAALDVVVEEWVAPLPTLPRGDTDQ